MRYIALSDLWISVYLIFTLFSKFSYCQDICQQPVWEKYEKVISENNSYKYSHYYKYSQRIRLNQPYPVISDSFKTVNDNQDVIPKFMFQYYGRNVSKLKIGTLGSIEIFGEKKLGNINHNIPAFFDMTYEILDNNQLIAIKWNLRIFVNELKSKVTSVIHPSGKISFYYESITTEMEDNKRYSLIRGVFQCVRRDKDVVIEPQIIVPEKWIKSDTLVEFVPIEITCSEYNSIDECLNSKTFNMECIWCEKTNMCINSHELIVKDCHIENMTSEIIVYSKPNGTLYYLQIVLPIVILFWVVCTGCVIWIWLSRRKKNRVIHTTTDVKCAWCEETDKYIQSNDKNSPEVNVIDHRIEDVDHLNTQTLSYHNQTSLESTEVEIEDVMDTNE